MDELRLRAAALLDVLGYRGREDRTAAARADARRYRAARASGRFPQLELEWAWADNLDTRPEIAGVRTVFGALAAWWPESSPRPPGTLVLAGRTGPGKTVGAVWLASRRGGEFMTAAELGELALAAEAQLARIIATPLLVIDDLGDETTIGPTLERVRRVLKDRHAAKRTTLVTSNSTPPQLVERYGDHIDDRVRATGGCVHIRGRSRRRLRAEPSLEGITRTCRIADLVEAVDAMTGAGDRRPDPRLLAELQKYFQVSPGELEQAASRRLAWSGGQGRASS